MKVQKQVVILGESNSSEPGDGARKREREGEGWMKGSSAVLGSPGLIRQLGFLLELRDGARCVQALRAPPRRTSIQSPVASAPHFWEYIKRGLIFTSAVSHFHMELWGAASTTGAPHSTLCRSS